MIKHITFTILTILWIIPIESACQNTTQISKYEIIGLWQYSSDEIGSGYLETYRFFNNNRFIFHPSEYDELKRITEIKGTYKIEDQTITFFPDSITELIGGTLERSKFTSISDSWSLTNTTVLKSSIICNPQEALIEKIVDKCKLGYYILIDKRTFFKIFDDTEK